MKKTIEKLIVFGLMGSIAGGIFAGGDYDLIVLPAMILYTLAFFKVVQHFGQTLQHPKQSSKIIDVVFFAVYGLFMFQTGTVLLTGTTMFPTLWWAVHGGVATYVYLLVHSITRP